VCLLDIVDHYAYHMAFLIHNIPPLAYDLIWERDRLIASEVKNNSFTLDAGTNPSSQVSFVS
jgi:hypothetical protein